MPHNAASTIALNRIQLFIPGLITRLDFKAAMAFVNRMAEVAEAEQHHPDFTVHYNQVDVEVWTHVAKGLTENDFILAAKINQLTPAA